MSIQLFFGYIGLWNMIFLLPVAICMLVSSSNGNNQGVDSDSSSEWEPPSSDYSREEDTTDAVHRTITRSIFLFLLLRGLLDTILPDYLWARAVIITSAPVASVGVGLTIPMAFVADWITRN